MWYGTYQHKGCSMPQMRGTQRRGVIGSLISAAMLAVPAAGQGLTIDKQPAWNTEAAVVGRVVVQSPQGASVILMSGVPGDLFGFAAVAVSDVNADGVEDVAVAAPMATGDGKHGCVYVCSGSTGEKLATLWGEVGERFGSGLDVVADADADGIGDLRVAVMDGPLADLADKARFADGWRVMSSVSGATLSSGSFAQLPEGVNWHAVVDDANGMIQPVRKGDSADLDADGVVGEQDFLQLVQLVADAMQSGPGAPGPRLGDVNGDGLVDQGDIGALVAKVGVGAPPTSYVSQRCRGDNPVFDSGRICWDVVGGQGPHGPGDDGEVPDDGGGGGGDGGGGDGGGGGDEGGGGDDEDPDDGGGGSDDDNDPDDGGLQCDVLDTDNDGIRDPSDCDQFSPPGQTGCCATVDNVRAQDDPENEECWGPKRPLVDLDIDTNNNSQLAPHRSLTEERLEDVPEAIGKVILINDNDNDQDGIPDFADGYNRDGEPNSDDESTDGDSFVHMKLQLTCAAVNEVRDGDAEGRAYVTFWYDGSDPNEVTVNYGADGPVYTPAPGRIRIWKKNGGDRRDSDEVSDYGDWIEPGVAYLIEDLGCPSVGGVVDLYVEGIEAGRSFIDVECGARYDSVPVSVIGHRFVKATENGPGAPLVYPDLSHPSPTIDARITVLTDVAASVDGQHIVGLLWLAGDVRDALSDQIPGGEGSIDEMRVLLNGEPVRHGGGETSEISLAVSKGQQQSLIRPYPFKGSFNHPMYQVRLRPGINTLRLEATNSMGFVGYYERQFEVTWSHSAREQFDVQFERVLGLDASSGLEVTWTFTGPDGPRSGQALLTQVNDNTWTNGIDQVVVSFDELGAPVSASVQLTPSDGMGALPAWTRDAMPLEVAQDNDHLWLLSESFERESLSWLQHTFGVIRYGPSASQGGFISHLLIEVLGPKDEALEKLEEVQLDGVIYQLVTIGERTFLSREGLGRPSVFLVMRDARDLETVIREQDGPRRDGAVNFAQGFAMGLYDAGENNVVGLWETGEFIVNANIHFWEHYNPYTMTWRFIESGDILLEDDAAVVKAGITMISDVASSAGQMLGAQGDALYRGILLGDEGAMNELDAQMRESAELAADLLMILDMVVTDADDFEKGRFVGMVIGEMGIAVGTAGTSTATRASVIPRMVQKLRQLQRVSSNPVAMQRLDTLLAGVLLLGRIQSQAAQASWAVVKPFIDALDGNKLEGLKAAISATRELAARNKLLEGMWEVVYALDDSHIADAMARAPGQRHLGFPTFRDYPPNLGGSWLKKAGLNRHHGFPVEYSQKLNGDGLGFPVIDPDDTPCMLLTKDHNGNLGGSDAFHAILNHIENGVTPTTVDAMVNNLRRAYVDFGRPDMIHVIEDWLRANGRLPPN